MWLLCKSSGKSRYLLRILTALTCGVFIFVFYFVNGVQQQVKLQVAERLESAVAVVGEYARQRCVLPIYWAAGQSSSRYAVLYNFIPSDNVYAWGESVTYTTHATYPFLSHAEEIAERWNGPISVAVYAPATDFDDTLSVIAYLRQCRAPSVRQLITFHLFFDAKYKPLNIPCSLEDYVATTTNNVDCDNFTYKNRTFQADNNITYPVNVARNIARITAQTRYVLPSDIELYPSANLIPMFLDMVAVSQSKVNHTQPTSQPTTSTTTTTMPTTVTSNLTAAAANKTNKKMSSTVATTTTTVPPNVNDNNNVRTVYVLPLFEVDKSLSAPLNKSQLLALIAKGKVVPFHKFVCPECHRVPKQDDWLKFLPPNDTMSVFYSTKRHKPFQNWEPVYIGTNDEPLYDERLNWEGMSDKMTQAYEMCLLDYNFSILDNAFLVHAPGIKRFNKTANQWRKGYASENSKLRRQIKKELNTKYTVNSKCTL